MFPLPEAQLDRFFLKAVLGYPRADEELRIVQAQRHGHPLDRLEPVIGIDDLRAFNMPSRMSTSTRCCSSG